MASSSVVGWRNGFTIEMREKTLVSVIIIFLNAEKYLEEAIESVCAQTYDHWELLLIDDGSTDGSTDIARRYARQKAGKVYYLSHPGHINRGMSASRNLGIRAARGQYIALLDADDVWLPHKLAEQVVLLEIHDEAGMLYGQSLYWYSWTQNPSDEGRDFLPVSGIPAQTLMQPAELLPLFLSGKTTVPCPSSILVRRSVMETTGGFVETFVGPYTVYEDQAFYSKVCLQTPILVCNTCWARYRQHPNASTAISQKTGQETAARQFFLTWLQEYLRQQEVTDTMVWQALRQEMWLLTVPEWAA
jgi:cellulose synthase/poly-beta-1,6-N-acetylglucosamine synthase-like glycosyltransferase